MTTLSEFAIFKLCVENPQKLDNTLSQLNLQFVPDPADQQKVVHSDFQALEITQRKALRLFYMVWSAVTKTVKNTVIG